MSELKEKTFDGIRNERIRFVIPYLQRTYKWRESQARQMLEDFAEFLEQGKSNYCMQPLAVVDKGNRTYELLDGQQRLTTLLLLWRILFEGEGKEYPYTFAYERDKHSSISEEQETDEGRFAFITTGNAIKDPERECNNMDEYYMSVVYETIENWMHEHTKSKEEFRRLLEGSDGHHILFLWYEVSEEERHTTFAHINSGKIELTCADLIKALLLSESTTSLPDKSLVAAQYAEMEQALCDDHLWYMLQAEEPLYNGSRMDLLFNLVKGVSKDQYTLERKTAFDRVYAERQGIADFWKQCRNCFVRLMDLYENPYTYHYIGYLTYAKGKYEIGQWIKDYESSGLTGVIDKLKAEIRRFIVNLGDLETLTYENCSKQALRQLFLLHNLQTILCRYEAINEAGLGLRFSFEQFPFELLYAQKWDIEHIASKTDNPLTRIQDCIDWIKSAQADYPEIFGEEEVETLVGVFENEPTLNHFKPVYEKVVTETEKGIHPVRNKDGLGNLVLLDRHTNRSYHNALYKRKRRVILHASNMGRTEEGIRVTFIPQCTRNVFLKTYNDDIEVPLIEWTQEDYDRYFDDINEKLSKL